MSSFGAAGASFPGSLHRRRLGLLKMLSGVACNVIVWDYRTRFLGSLHHYRRDRREGIHLHRLGSDQLDGCCLTGIL